MQYDAMNRLICAYVLRGEVEETSSVCLLIKTTHAEAATSERVASCRSSNVLFHFALVGTI